MSAGLSNSGIMVLFGIALITSAMATIALGPIAPGEYYKTVPMLIALVIGLFGISQFDEPAETDSE